MATYGTLATVTSAVISTLWTAPAGFAPMQVQLHALSGDHLFTLTWNDGSTDIFPVMSGLNLITSAKSVINRIAIVQTQTSAGAGSAAVSVIQIGTA